MTKVGILVSQDQLGRFLDFAGQTRILHGVSISESPDKEKLLAPYPSTTAYSQAVNIRNRLAAVREELGLTEAEGEILDITAKSLDEITQMLEDGYTSVEAELRPLTSRREEIQKTISSLESMQSNLQLLQGLGYDSLPSAKSAFMNLRVGEASKEQFQLLQKTLSETTFDNYLTLTHEVGKDLVSLLVFYPSAFEAEVTRAFTASGARSLDVPRIEDKSSPSDLKARMEGMEHEYGRVEKEKAELAKRLGPKVVALLELANVAEQRARLLTLAGNTKSICYLEGWVPTQNLQQFKEESAKACGNRIEIVEEDWKKIEDDPPPTYFRSPGILKQFQSLIDEFSIPNYEELNPAPFLLLTFPIIFGLMFGDVPQGLVLVVAGIIALRVSKSAKKTSEMAGFVVKAGMLLLAFGISSTIFGVLYGSYSGIHIEGVHPLWFEPLEDPQAQRAFLRIALYVGFIHISAGLVLGIINLAIKKDYIHAIFSKGCWLWFYLGLVYFFLRYGIRDILGWLSKPEITPLILVPLILMFTGGGLATLATTRSLHHFRSHIGGSLIEGIEAGLASLGSTVSYVRIFALNIVHGTLVFLVAGFAAYLYNSGNLGVGIAGMLAAALLNAIVVIGEGLIVFAHSLRLHWVEWLGKFYQGDGLRYAPYTENRQWVTSTW